MQNLPYRIIRSKATTGYLFQLVEYDGDTEVRLLSTVHSPSPIAPQAMRDFQGRLNTRAVLDYGR